MKRQLLSVALALLIVSGMGATAVQTGMVDRGDVSPVGESRAIACGGICLVGAGAAAGIAVGAVAGSHYFSDASVDSEELSRLDSLETKKEMHSSASSQHQNNLILTDSYKNYLQDTPETATMIGKNAYIKQLEAGASEAEARAAARENVSDYYATKQIQLLRSWETSMESAVTIQQQARNDTNIDDLFITGRSANGYIYNGTQHSFATTKDHYSISLVNGTESRNVTTADFSGDTYTVTFAPDQDPRSQYGGTGDPADGIGVKAPNSNYDTTYLINVTTYYRSINKIEQQNQNVQGRIDNFVNNTYTEYQEGAINSSDLVDPYLGAREYSPDNEYGSWTLRTMSSLGLNSPSELSNTGSMEIKDHETGDVYTGVLMTDETPSGGIENGATYNAANLGGPQFVVSEENQKTYELNGNFTVQNITDASGNVTSSVQYTNISYQTTSLSEYEQLQQQLRNLTAEINARQAQERSGGGGLLGSGNIDPVVALVVLAGLAAVVMYGNNGGGRNGRRR